MSIRREKNWLMPFYHLLEVTPILHNYNDITLKYLVVSVKFLPCVKKNRNVDNEIPFMM